MWSFLASLIICLRHFSQGVRMLHVDYATRHYSRCYSSGIATGACALLASPIALLIGLGVFIGWLICA